MRARKPGLQALINLAGSKIKNTHSFPLLFLSQKMIFNGGNSTHHVSCLYSEGKAIKPIYHVKLVAEYAFSLRAPSHIENWLAGSGGDSRTGLLMSNQVQKFRQRKADVQSTGEGYGRCTKGCPHFKKVQFFLTLFERPLTPPPFYLNICPILQGVFFERVFEHLI